ncbi:ras GTPase-activating protein-binding protein 1-like [Lethenteron reissneri]|uniref:ras GTPase-activating protein-binding protein 1-like n=1 Tax=Lethenteron reissneri TaxID=7753 RepID=UPI002AB6AFF5|nr:ras GTPase-activating protein-binding protein 1-like [Lethenteron reissneri]
MVMETPHPLHVGREFVRQYYTLLHQAPDFLHRFYGKDSTFVHGGVDANGKPSDPVVGQTEIHAKIVSLAFRDCRTKIRAVDSQATMGGAVVVQVLGELSNAGGAMRRFLQTFILAPEGSVQNKFFVQNDIFRYQDEVFTDSDHSEDLEEEEEEEEGEGDSEVENGSPLYETHSPGNAPSDMTQPISNNTQHHYQQQQQQQHQQQQQLHQLPKDEMRGDAAGRGGVADEVVEAEVEEEEEVEEEVSPTTIETHTASSTSAAAAATSSAAAVVAAAAAVASATAATASAATAAVEPAPAKPFSWASVTSKNLSQGGGLPAQTANTFVHHKVVPTQANVEPKPEPPRGTRGEGRPGGPPLQSRPPPRQVRGGDTDPSVDGEARRFPRYADSQQLFVGNLPYSMEETSLRDFFSSYGTVLSVRINTQGASAVTGRKLPNYGFVIFSDADSVQKILAAKPIMYQGDHRLNVEEKKRRGFREGGGAGGGGGRGGGGRGYGGSRPSTAPRVGGGGLSTPHPAE